MGLPWQPVKDDRYRVEIEARGEPQDVLYLGDVGANEPACDDGGPVGPVEDRRDLCG